MEFNQQWLFFFSALGAFNGLFLSLYFLFFARPKHPANYFLGGLLLTLSVRIGKSVIFHFNPDLSYIFLQLGLSACVFIGPFLYFYLKSVIHAESKVDNSWKYHFGGLFLLTTIGGYCYPFEQNIDLWRPCIIVAIYWIWLVYLIGSLFLMKGIIRRFLTRKDRLHSVEIWILSVFIGNVLIWSAYYFWGFFSYILGALLFSFVLYLLVLLLIFNKKKDSILFKNVPKYADKKIETTEATDLLKALNDLMTQQELFKNPTLKLPDVAEKLNILPHRLSQLLNDNLGKNFPSFINEFRIEAAKKMLLSNDEFTLEGIGYECGFNSKSTFYTTFKKHTGLTPAKFKQNTPTN